MVEALWVRVQDALRSRLSTKDVDSWIRPLRPRGWAANRLTLEAPSAFARDWLTRHLRGEIEAAVSTVAGEPARVLIEVAEAVEGRRPRERTARRPATKTSTPAGTKHRYSFDSFVIGRSNSVAFRACRSVVEAPGARFNPLVIHGGVGLGKTHLLSATAMSLEGTREGVRLVTAERFVNELVQALRNDGMQRFRDRYRDIGVLIVDDVQFLGGKRKSQEEFIHTFNTLRDLGKQIVLASDRPPEELTEMSAPLRSRIGSGLLAGIEPPDQGMRVELVRRKLGERKIEVAPGVPDLLAGEAWASVRELEGAVLRLEAVGALNDDVLDERAVVRILGWATRRPAKRIDVGGILDAVCGDFGVSRDAVLSRGRTAEVALARQVVIHLTRTLTELSLKAIGHSIGRRDHSTVAHAVHRVERRLADDPKLRERVRRLEGELSRCGGVEWACAMDGTDGTRGTR